MVRATDDSPEPDNGRGRQTVLDRHLAGLQPEKPSPIDALLLAKDAYNRGERIDMGVLAAELGVSRVTLNRWVGTREDLIGEVTWDLMRRTLERTDAKTNLTGGERIVVQLCTLLDTAANHKGHQTFVEREGPLAMRVNISPEGRVEPRLVDYVRQLLREETDAGRLKIDVDLDDLAYAVVQIVIAFTWRPFITGEPANAEAAESVVRLLLCRDD